MFKSFMQGFKDGMALGQTKVVVGRGEQVVGKAMVIVGKAIVKAGVAVVRHGECTEADGLSTVQKFQVKEAVELAQTVVVGAPTEVAQQA